VTSYSADESTSQTKGKSADESTSQTTAPKGKSDAFHLALNFWLHPPDNLSNFASPYTDGVRPPPKAFEASLPTRNQPLSEQFWADRWASSVAPKLKEAFGITSD